MNQYKLSYKLVGVVQVVQYLYQYQVASYIALDTSGAEFESRLKRNVAFRCLGPSYLLVVFVVLVPVYLVLVLIVSVGMSTEPVKAQAWCKYD